MKGSQRAYTADDSEQFKDFVQFDCRGCEPTGFQFRDGFTAAGVESATVFNDINLGEEWADYDEKSAVPVAINELEFRFKRV